MTENGLVLITTSHRVAAGLLSRQAWRALEGSVIFRRDDHPLADVVGGQPFTGDPSAAVRRAATDPVVLLLDTADAEAVGPALATALLAADPPPVVESVPGSWDLPGARLLDLVAVMDRLRSPGGCPWDAEQTHATLLPYLLEETYETVEAVEAGDVDALREELGDLLLQVVFHARVAEEGPGWGIDEVAAGIAEKLVRRHPHVFGSAEAATAADVEATWEQAKRVEKGRDSAVDGVPLAQPALSLAAALIGRAQRAGVAVATPEWSGPFGDAEEVGELLLALVARAQSVGVDAEAALREAARGYAGRVRAAERAAGEGPAVD